MNKKKCPSCNRITPLKDFHPNCPVCRFCKAKIYRKLKRQQRSAKTAELRKEAMDKLGGVCLFCGFSDIRALQFDHVEGGGNQHLKGLPTYRYYQSIIDGSIDVKIQLLCSNCNWIKRVENNEVRTTQYECNKINIK